MTSLMLWGIWLAMALVTGCLACRYIRRAYQTDWYDLSKKGPFQELEWQQICDVMDLKHFEKDPLDSKHCWRCPWKRVCRDLAVSAIFVLVFLAGALLICDPGLWCVVAKGGGGLGVPAALAAVGGTAVVVFYNVRLTARSNNRQAWINSVRRNIHALIANCPSNQEIDQKQSMKTKRHLTMLELMLNPGERVHRSLIAILRLMHGIHDNPLDRVVLCKLDLGGPTGQQLPDNGENARECPGDMKARATRLANVLLKREWEQVKHVR